MPTSHPFTYHHNRYEFEYNPRDPSGLGCIWEIVTSNTYSLELFCNLVDQTIIDIGANCGVATIILAKQNPLSTIYAFEPHPQTYQLLLNNIKLNHLDNVKPFNQAMSDNLTQQITLVTHPDYSGGNTTYADSEFFKTHFSNPQNVQEISVPCTSLDKWIDQYQIKHIEVMKIDCEGAEYDIFYQSQSLKQQVVTISNLVGEFHNLHWNNHIQTKAEDLLTHCQEIVTDVVKVSILNL